MSDRSDYETAELVLAWLREYGLAIILGVLASLGLSYGYRWYQSQQLEQQRLYSQQVMDLAAAVDRQDETRVQALQASLRDADEAFRRMGDLLQAQLFLRQGKRTEALPLLQSAAQSPDIWLASMAQRQQVGLLLDENKDAEALQALEKLRGGMFQEDIAWLQALIHERQGEWSQALALYESLPDSQEKTWKISALQAQLRHL